MITAPRTYGISIQSIDTPSADILFDPESNIPYVDATLGMLVDDDLGRSLLQRSLNGDDVRLLMGERSGLARFGVENVIDYDSLRKVDDHAYLVNARICAISDIAQQSFLSVLRVEVSAGQPINVGSMVLLPQSARMDKEGVLSAVDDQSILLPDGYILTEDGRILIPVGSVHYETNSRRRITRNEVRDILWQGKYPLEGMQSPMPGYPDTNKDFVVGGIAVSLGSKMGILLQDTVKMNNEGKEESAAWKHLSAVRLDPYRTTGMADLSEEHPDFDCVRQLELRRTNGISDPLEDVYVQLELYHTGPERITITEAINRRGISFFDSHLVRNPVVLQSALDLVDVKNSYKNTGILIGPGRAVSVPYISHEEQQKAELLKTALPAFLADSPSAGDPNMDILLRGSALPESIKMLAEEVLVNIGGTQKDSKMYATTQFQDMHELFASGIGIFLAKGLKHRNGSDSNGEVAREYFTGSEHHEYRQLAKKGALICRYKDKPHDGESHLTIFDKGFWVDPDRLEEFDRVSTYVATYGTHKDEFMPALYESAYLSDFMNRYKYLLKDEAGITHGKGIGFMGAVDMAAKESRIWQSAVGINAGSRGQGKTHGQDACVEMAAEDRLDRQKAMDDIGTFKMFGIGGGGTLEEAAITICSQKLYAQVPTPLIFVDFMGRYRNDKSHLWTDLRELIERFASDQSLYDGQSDIDAKQILSLIDSWVPNNIHLVDRFGDNAETLEQAECPSAITIIEQFHANPPEYWKNIGVLPAHWTHNSVLSEQDQILVNKLWLSFDSMKETFTERGIRFPEWLAQYNPRWTLAK